LKIVCVENVNIVENLNVENVNTYVEKLSCVDMYVRL